MRQLCGINDFQDYFDDAKESRVKQFSNNQDSRTIKFQESRLENNQDQDSRIKRRLNQDKYQKGFSKQWVAQEFFTKSFT